MSFIEWLKKEWHLVEGNARWDFYKWVFAATGSAVIALGAYLVHRLRYGPDWLPYAIAFVFAVIVFFWMGSKMSVPSVASPKPVAVLPAGPIQQKPLNPHAPDLRADIREVLFHSKRLPLSNDIFLLLSVSVVNHGENEVVVTQWDLRLEVGDAEVDCEEEPIPSDWRIRRINPVSNPRVTVDDINRDSSTFREPLRRGVPKERWVCFRVPVLFRMLPPHNAKLVLTLTDAFGQSHVKEEGPGFTSDMGEIVSERELPSPQLPSPASVALAESTIEKIEKVGKLRSLAGRAEFLRDYLEEVWHLFLKEKKNMPNPLGKNSVPDAITDWSDKQLWRFRVRFQDYLGSMNDVDPDFESDLLKEGFPSEGEDYLSVERKISEHTAKLRIRADELLAEAAQ